MIPCTSSVALAARVSRPALLAGASSSSSAPNRRAALRRSSASQHHPASFTPVMASMAIVLPRSVPGPWMDPPSLGIYYRHRAPRGATLNAASSGASSLSSASPSSSAQGSRRHGQVAVQASSAEGIQGDPAQPGNQTEEEMAKAEKRARKDEKRARKMQEQMAKAMEKQMENEAMLIESAQKLLDAQAAVYAQDRAYWQQEREAWQQREAKLLNMVETLTLRISDMATAMVASRPPEAAAVSAQPAPAVEKSAPKDSAPSQANSSSQQSSPASKPLLGGRGVLDVLDIIEEHQKQVTSSRSASAPTTGASSATPKAPQIKEPEPSTASAPVVPEPAAQVEAEIVDVDKTKPVTLQLGSDDIYWVNQLQAGLLRDGLHCGDQEMEDWYFGHQTQEALLTYQAMNGLQETGVCDDATWEKLLGPGFRAVKAEEMPLHVLQAAQDESTKATKSSASSDVKDMFAFLKEDSKEAKSSASTSNGATNSNKASKEKTIAAAAAATVPKTFEKWPILRLDDGNSAVHHLHAALAQAGFDCGEDEMRWWMYGDSTMSAVSFFQACNDLPETGIVDERTWKKLLGNPNAKPSDITGLMSGNSYDEDITDQGSTSSSGGTRIWLMGEQRWSEPM